ncbi:TPA: pLS20_p028 family conjugation system transmembrane protein [Enterococcus faecium]
MTNLVIANVITDIFANDAATTMKDTDILKILSDYSNYLTQGNPAWDFLRPVGMKIAEGMAWILDGLYGVMGDLLKLLNIFDNKAFVDLLEKVEPIKWLLLTLAILGFFVLFMFSKVNDASQAPLNLILLVCMTFMMPSLWATASTATQNIFKDLNTVEKSPGESIILENTTDLKAVAEEGWKLKDGETLNHYKHARQIDMKEKIEKPDDVKNGEPFKKKLVPDSKGEDTLEDIEQPSGFAAWLVSNFFSPNYYRNKVRFFNIYLTLLVSIIALGISSFKFAIIINKMYGDYVLLIKGGFADFMGMQRVKALFSEIIGSFALLVYVPILFQIYLVATAVIKSMNFNFFSYIIAMAGAAWALIDGPNGFQRVTGIDAGLRGTAGVVMTALGGSKLVKGAKDFGSTVAKSAGGALADVGAFGLGMSLGAVGSGNHGVDAMGLNDRLNNQDKDKKKGSEDSEDTKGFNEQEREKDSSQDQELSNENMNQEEANKDSETEDQIKGNEAEQSTNESNDVESPDFDSLESLEPTDNEEDNDAFDQSKGFNEIENPEMLNSLEPFKNENGQDSLNNSDIPVSSAQDEMDQLANQEDIPKETDDHLSGLSASEALSDDLNASPDQSKVEQHNNEINQKLAEHKKLNPLKKAAKDKVFGYAKDDSGRYHKRNFREKRRDAFDLGKNYSQYRQKKKELINEKKKEDE